MKIQNNLSYAGTNKYLREFSYSLLNQDTWPTPQSWAQSQPLSQTSWVPVNNPCRAWLLRASLRCCTDAEQGEKLSFTSTAWSGPEEGQGVVVSRSPIAS